MLVPLTAIDLENELILSQTGRRTALLDAITLGLEKMRSARYAKKALLIISDGGDNHSRYSESVVRAAARESDVLIYSIGIFDHYAPTLEEALGPALLSEIAEPTGGRAFTVDDVGALPAVAHQIGMELRTQSFGSHEVRVVRKGRGRMLVRALDHPNYACTSSTP